MDSSKALGSEPISKLLIKQSVPAAVGFLVLSLYTIVDTFFVGRWVEGPGIAALTVIMPVSFLISSVGMAIGIGGASLISRALGAKDKDRAEKVLGNQVFMIVILGGAVFAVGMVFMKEIIYAFGGKGTISPLAVEYFGIMMYGIPFLMWAMMANNVIRAQGKSNLAMKIMIIPSVVNAVLDPLLIIYFDLGMAGAAWATTISYWISGGYTLYFFLSGKSEVKLRVSNFSPQLGIVSETASIGGITIARQAATSLLVLIVNHVLYGFSGETGIEVYGIVNRLVMFAIFPIIGIMQGFMSIVGYNYGAIQYDRVKEALLMACKYGFGISCTILAIILLGAKGITAVFTTNDLLIDQSPFAMTMVFLLLPLVSLQMIGASYFQAIGKALPALVLTLTRQVFFLIPLILILPKIYGELGVWIAFPISDLLSAVLTVAILFFQVKKMDEQKR